nr:hypothetical protein OH820_35140 [Streptomyces sp. NBC_00857]
MAKEPKRISVPESLVDRQRAANAVRREATRGEYSAQAWKPWLDAAMAVQQGITEHAAASGENRVDVEMATKLAAREADEAEG